MYWLSISQLLTDGSDITDAKAPKEPMLGIKLYEYYM